MHFSFFLHFSCIFQACIFHFFTLFFKLALPEVPARVLPVVVSMYYMSRSVRPFSPPELSVGNFQACSFIKGYPAFYLLLLPSLVCEGLISNYRTQGYQDLFPLYMQITDFHTCDMGIALGCVFLIYFQCPLHFSLLINAPLFQPGKVFLLGLAFIY